MRNNGIHNRWKYLDIIPLNKSYYYINEKLIKYNKKADFFNSLYIHIMYIARI